MKIQRLFIYPIKSLGGIEVASSAFGARGLNWDRRFMLVDDQGVFLTQRTNPILSQFKLRIEMDRIIVTFQRDLQKIEVPLGWSSGSTIACKVWNDEVEAIVASEKINAFFSERLDQHVRLVYMPDTSIRPVDPKYGETHDHTSFSDGYPILIVGTASLNLLNEKMDLPIDWDRFRPNVVIDTDTAHVEDTWSFFEMGTNTFRGVKPCARCVMTTIDQASGIAGKEPLKTLSTYRNVNNKVLFGMNVIPNGQGLLSVGDEVITRKS